MRSHIFFVLFPVFLLLASTHAQGNSYYPEKTSVIDSVFIEFNDSVSTFIPDTLFLDLHTGKKGFLKVTLMNNSLVDLNLVIKNDGLKGHNYAIEFDGVNDYITGPTNGFPVGNESRTMELWFNCPNLQDDNVHMLSYGFWGIGDQVFSLELGESGLCFTPWNPTYIITSKEFQQDLWYHVALVSIGNNIQFYINGNLELGEWQDGDSSYIINTAENTRYLIGGDQDILFRRRFQGMIDEVRVWKSVRTQEQIRESMFREITGPETDLVAYLKFNESSGDTVLDASFLRNHGIILNNAKRVASTAPVNIDWLKTESDTILISNTFTKDFYFYVDGSGINEGNYTDRVIMQALDPEKHKVMIPVRLSVKKAPDIRILNDSISWQVVALGTDSIRPFRIFNSGSDLLEVSTVEVNNSNYRVKPSSLMIKPFGSREVVVTCTPTLMGKPDGVLSIVSNDPDMPLVEVTLNRQQLIIPRNMVIRWILFTFFIVLVLILLLIFYRFRLKQQLNNQLELKISEALEIQEQQQQIIVHQAGLTSLGEIAAGIAQEVSIPLQNILLANESIEFEESKKETNPHNVYAMVKEIYKDVDNINKLIEHVKLFASQQKTDMSDDFSINETIVSALSMIAVKMANQKIKIVMDLQEDLPEIGGNPFKLEQVIINLMNNAGEALESKGRERTANVIKTVVVKTALENNHILVNVTDNGIGIPVENMASVFLPFYTTKRTGKGIGLGLSISRGIINEMKGTIHVSSKKGAGTECVIKLPIHD